MYFDMGDEKRSREAITKAYALRDTVNDYERFFIEFGYHWIVTGDLQAQLKILRQWASTYPSDASPLSDLASLETQLGQYGNAAFYADHTLDTDRRAGLHDGINYEIAARAYLHANMPDKLRAVYAEAGQWKAETPGLHAVMLQFAANSGDAAGVEREIARSRNTPDECHVLQCAGLAALAAGQARRAEELFAEATVAGQRDDLRDTLTDLDDYHARMLAELGLTKEAKAMLKRLPPADSTLDKAFTEAEVGGAAEALAEAQQRQAAAPADTLMSAEYAPSVRAAIALRQGKPNEAIELLQADAPYELRDPTVPYLRGQAYLAAHQAPQAMVEFEEIADRPWLFEPGAPLIVLAHLGLARAYALGGNFAGSRNEYQRFFALWKDADADLPILRQAHLEYERIR